MPDTSDERPKDRSVENEDQKPMGDGQPPRSKSEPRGSEGSSNSAKTRTDPASGEHEGGDIGPASLRDTP